MQFSGFSQSSARGNATPPAASTLAPYFGEIGDARVLRREEERELALRFRARRAEVHGVLAGLPFTGAALSDRWRARQATPNPIRGLLVRSPQAYPHRAICRLEASVRRVERRLRRTPPLAPRASADEAAWDRFESLQRGDLLALDLSPDFYREVERALRCKLDELEAAADASARRRTRDEVGLPLPRFRWRMRTLGPLASSRDEARNELARHNLKLVVRFAKEFRNLGVDFPDLIQEGNLGLLRAIDLFEPERGLKLSTYAMWWIRQALVRAIQKQSRTVRLPSHINERLHQMGRASDRLSGRLGRSPTDGELARETGLESDRVEDLRALVKMPLSLDRAADPKGSPVLHERLPDPNVASPLDRIDAARDRRAVGALLTRLDARERIVIGRRFGFSGEDRVPLEHVAREFGLSRELVRRIEKRALSKLRGWAEGARPNGWEDIVSDIVDEHYRRLANRYDEFLHYSPDFVRVLTSKMIEMLELQSDDILVDLGCGTGMYARDILRQVPLKAEVVGVDPCEDMLRSIPPDTRIRPVRQDALEFSNQPNEFDKVLMKEAIHHVKDRRSLLANLHRGLPPGGRILLVHVALKLQYPLFRGALDRCERWHADPDKLEALMRDVGYAVDRDAVDYMHAIPKETYFAMVEKRYMSVLSSLLNEELAAGLVEMRETYAERPVLEFADHFDFILGIRE